MVLRSFQAHRNPYQVVDHRWINCVIWWILCRLWFWQGIFSFAPILRHSLACDRTEDAQIQWNRLNEMKYLNKVQKKKIWKVDTHWNCLRTGHFLELGVREFGRSLHMFQWLVILGRTPQLCMIYRTQSLWKRYKGYSLCLFCGNIFESNFMLLILNVDAP